MDGAAGGSELRVAEHAARFRALARGILASAEEGRPRGAFLARALRLLLEDASADRVVLRVRERGEEVVRTLSRGSGRVAVRRDAMPPSGSAHVGPGEQRSLDPDGSFSTRLGSVFASGERLRAVLAIPEGARPPHLRGIEVGTAASVAWMPLGVGADPRAVVVLARDGGEPLDRHEVRLYEALAQILAVALDQQNARWALAERIKELTCLYEIERVAVDRELPLDEALRRIARTLPPAMQHPAAASARIVVDGAARETAAFCDGPHRLAAPIVAHGVRRGIVEVVYRDEVDDDEEVFLREERALLAAVGVEVGRLLERDKATRERARLEEQLRHADRLATIGTLASGVAHELNEPLGSVLGLAQLAAKTEGIPGSAAQDLDKIVRAALHAREIVRKLMLFARNEPMRKAVVRPEAVVGDALDLLSARCAEAGVTVERRFDPDLPDLFADEAQVRQVVVNLAVNAIQAMPSGGTLRVRLAAEDGTLLVEVADEGTGMDEETQRRIFTPFFTTKEVGEGTGLGLAVAHGIVTAHGGTIEFDSAPGAGSRFRVRLPARLGAAPGGGAP